MKTTFDFDNLEIILFIIVKLSSPFHIQHPTVRYLIKTAKNVCRRGGPPISLSSTRLKRGSVQTGGSGDDSTTQDESIDGEETVN